MLGILHPTSTHFNRSTSSTLGSYMDASWAEDDAWDSASDSESPKRPSTFATTNVTSAGKISRTASSNSTTNSAGSISSSTANASAGSRPVPVVRKPQAHQQFQHSPTNSSSSSNLAFSYTHVNAPNPSSYPPKGEFIPPQRVADSADASVSSSKPSVGSQKGGWTIVQTTAADEAADDSHGQREGREPEEDSDLMIVGDMEGLDLSGSVQSIDDSIIADNLFKSKRRNEDLEKIRRDVIEIVADPLHAIRTPRRRKPSPIPSESPSSSTSDVPPHLQSSHSREKSEKLMRERSIRSNRKAKFVECLSGQDVNINELRKLAWAGIPKDLRPMAWQLLLVFMSAYIDEDPEVFDPALLPKPVVDAIEADSFWCLSRLLDGIQDNYISAQPGIHRSVKRMQELVARIDPTLSSHLDSQNVEFMQFAFRWMNCLLMREISVQNTIRMWDTYLAEGADAFSQFHLYVCCAFLVRWSDKLKHKDFQDIIIFLQSLPTQGWGDHEIELLLSEAFVLNATWHNAQSHFSGK
ncbi:hypothetical protein EST38_g4575 [Candolleomyces aberdarensis]|uniref:Rab-GAP TBC domain-containing protein n=1 Tax=Candolleomyces aberdarensis TaxID=2316362 RepID=A0A4Q2DMN7_9AGAR|nr:hypothetical protein EST38_g4575 [Candolleomyces aberdarensis]